MRILKLFGVRKPNGYPVEGLFFFNRSSAEKKRDTMSGYVVCPGPDHKRYQSMLDEIERQQLKEKS